MARATRSGRTKLPPSSFVAYRFACARACPAATSGHVTATGRGRPIALKAARFKGGPGKHVDAKVTLPKRAVRLITRRRRAQLALDTVVMSGASAARLAREDAHRREALTANRAFNKMNARSVKATLSAGARR